MKLKKKIVKYLEALGYSILIATTVVIVTGVVFENKWFLIIVILLMLVEAYVLSTAMDFD